MKRIFFMLFFASVCISTSALSGERKFEIVTTIETIETHEHATKEFTHTWTLLDGNHPELPPITTETRGLKDGAFYYEGVFDSHPLVQTILSHERNGLGNRWSDDDLEEWEESVTEVEGGFRRFKKTITSRTVPDSELSIEYKSVEWQEEEAQAAAARASIDIEVVAAQADRDAKSALENYLEKSQVAVKAQMDAVNDPFDIIKSFARDKAAKEALEAQVGAAKAAKFAYEKKIAAQEEAFENRKLHLIEQFQSQSKEESLPTNNSVISQEISAPLSSSPNGLTSSGNTGVPLLQQVWIAFARAFAFSR